MVFRIEKTKNYTVMSNYHLRDKNLSLKAKGLLSWMLSNNDDWDYSIAGIVACCKEGETTINTALRELQKYGYVVVTKHKPNEANNRIHYEYNVYETPQGVDSLGVESLGVESQALENQVQRNTNKTNTKKRNTNKTNTKEEEPFLHTKPIKESLYSKCIHMIDDFTNDAQLRIDLTDYLKLLLEMKSSGYILYANSWKGILNKLAKLSDDVDAQCEIVRQSIERGYKSVFPVNSYNKRNKDDRTVFGEGRKGEVQCDQYTDDELEELRKLDDERKRKGLQTKF